MRRYRIIVADPAWKFRDNLPGKRGVKYKYKSTLTLAQIMSLNIPPTEEDALLFLWRVASMVPEAYDVVRSWGFEGKSEWVWNKTESYVGLEPPLEPDPPKMPGMGHYVRNDHECGIIASKGSGCQLIQDLSVRSYFFAPRPPRTQEHHSEKPEIFFEWLDRLLRDVGPRAELFARENRPGYDCFGDELGTEMGWGLFV